jgi:hypothetical protein
VLRYILLIFLSINLYAENNYRLVFSSIEELYNECIDETEKSEKCQEISISNYEVVHNYLLYKLSKNSDNIHALISTSYDAQKSEMIQRLDTLLAEYTLQRNKNIKNDINYNNIFKQEFLDDYATIFEECLEENDENSCIEKVEKLEHEDVNRYYSKIESIISDKKSFANEQKEWKEYLTLYEEILKNNYESALSSEVYEGSMWNSVKDTNYNRAYTIRRAKLKSYLNTISK